MTIVYFDTETYCETDIRAGTHRYAEDVEIMVWAYAFDNGPVKVWDCTSRTLMPDDLADALDDPEAIFVAHNTHFDYTVLWHTGIRLPIERFRCTMAQALVHGLPGALDKLGDVMGIKDDQKKIKDGRALIQLFCKPRPKNMKLRRATRETHPAEWQRFLDYAANDIEAMRAIHKKLPKWNYREGGHELALWHLDQKINGRGVLIDLDLARAAIESSDRVKAQLAEATSDMTFGEVGAATQRDALMKHILEGYGVALVDLRTSTVETVLDNKDLDLPPVARELLENRLAASRTSTSKYQALIKATSSDGRLRGTLQFCGASRTGRWAGRIFQPQNLARVPKYLKKQYDDAVDTIKVGSVEIFYDNPMEVLGACVRGALIAPAGKKFCVSDLSNIESRALAWEAGETWKLNAFREFDAGRGADLYKLAYAKSFGVPVEKVDDGDQRQIGKVQELALGFAGGVGAFLTFAAAYGIDLEDMAQKAWASIPKEIIREATRAWDWAVDQDRTYGLPKEAYIVCDSFKRLWRYAHPETVAWWREVEDAAKQAVLQDGVAFEARCVKFIKTKAWLRMVLPSGRSLCYPSPQLDEGGLSYMGVNQFNRRWSRIKTYAGKLVENATQAIARDVLAANMPRMETEGYPILLTIHDEVICETPDTDAFSAKDLSRILSHNPKWAPDMPLAAAGFETRRYRKE